MIVTLTAVFVFAAENGYAQRSMADGQPTQENASAGKVLTRSVTVDLKQVSLREAVNAITKSASVRVQYQAHLLDTNKVLVTLRADKMPLGIALERIFAGTTLRAIPTGADFITIKAIEGATDSLNNQQKGNIFPGKKGSVRGKVIDSLTQRGVVGVTVVLAGNKIATSTGEDGSFHLANVPVGPQSISIRLLGYHTRTVAVTVDSDNVARVNVQLQATSTTLTEVITTATGSQRRAEISNDVVKIDAEKLIQAAPIRNVTDLLVAAQVPGMVVTPTSGEPGAPARIRLGGPGSISQNNDPVIIVDGVWIRSAFSDSSIRRKLGSNGGNNLFSSRLDAIDPSTIESIEIVRGPSAASLYGPDAANGVIKITTKRGRQGPARWDVRLFRDWSNPVGQKPNLYQGFGHDPNTNMAGLRCAIQDIVNGMCIQDSIGVLDQNSPLLSNEGNAFTNGISMSVTGGSGGVTYALSGSAQDQTSVRRMMGADRVRVRQLNLDVPGQFVTPGKFSTRSLSATVGMTPLPQLEVRVNVAGSQQNTRDNDYIVRGSGLRLDDTLRTLTQTMTPARTRSYVAATSILANIHMNWNPRPWWSGNFTLGLDRGDDRENRLLTQMACVGGICNPSASEEATADRKYSVYTARFQSTLLPNLGWASRFLDVRPGVTMDLKRDVRESGLFSSETPSVANPSIVTVTGGHKVGPNVGLAGVGVNMYIRLFNRLSLDPGFRRDFGTKVLQNNAKTYPRFGTSWMVSDESFFPKNGWVTSFRLRNALGYAAVQPQISAVRGLYYSSTRTLDGVTSVISTFTGAGNPALEPERSFEIESGFDADLLNDRVTLIVTHTNKQNKNTLIDRTLAPSAGVGTSGQRKENVARVVNTRTDVQIMTRVIERQGMTARATANFSFADNRVKTLGDGVSPFGKSEQRYVAGYPVGGLWRREIIAIGDANKNGFIEPSEMVLSDSIVYIGTNLPRMTAGYNIEATIMNLFTVNAMFGYKGLAMQNRSASVNEVLGYWDPTTPVDDQILGRVVEVDGGYDRQNFTEMRFQSASMTVNMPTNWARRMKARTMQISLQGNNLGLWTNYRGRDPGVNSSPIGERTSDNSSVSPLIPAPRAMSLQVRLGY